MSALSDIQPRAISSDTMSKVDVSTPIRRASASPWESGESRESTPREELFSREAAYDSVFRSRPKIKTSPRLFQCMTGMTRATVEWTIRRRGDWPTGGFDRRHDLPWSAIRIMLTTLV